MIHLLKRARVVLSPFQYSHCRDVVVLDSSGILEPSTSILETWHSALEQYRGTVTLVLPSSVEHEIKGNQFHRQHGVSRLHRFKSHDPFVFVDVSHWKTVHPSLEEEITTVLPALAFLTTKAVICHQIDHYIPTFFSDLSTIATSIRLWSSVEQRLQQYVTPARIARDTIQRLFNHYDALSASAPLPVASSPEGEKELDTLFSIRDAFARTLNESWNDHVQIAYADLNGHYRLNLAHQRNHKNQTSYFSRLQQRHHLMTHSLMYRLLEAGLRARMNDQHLLSDVMVRHYRNRFKHPSATDCEVAAAYVYPFSLLHECFSSHRQIQDLAIISHDHDIEELVTLRRDYVT